MLLFRCSLSFPTLCSPWSICLSWLPWPTSVFHAQGHNPGLRPTAMQQNSKAGPEMLPARKRLEQTPVSPGQKMKLSQQTPLMLGEHGPSCCTPAHSNLADSQTPLALGVFCSFQACLSSNVSWPWDMHWKHSPWRPRAGPSRREGTCTGEP